MTSNHPCFRSFDPLCLNKNKESCFTVTASLLQVTTLEAAVWNEKKAFFPDSASPYNKPPPPPPPPPLLAAGLPGGPGFTA